MLNYTVESGWDQETPLHYWTPSNEPQYTHTYTIIYQLLYILNLSFLFVSIRAVTTFSLSSCRLQNLLSDQSPTSRTPALPPSPSLPRVITSLISYFLVALVILKQSKLFSLGSGSQPDLWAPVPGTTRTPHVSLQQTIEPKPIVQYLCDSFI